MACLLIALAMLAVLPMSARASEPRNQEAVAHALTSGMPVLNVIRERYPDYFATLTDQYRASLQAGRSEQEAKRVVKSLVARFMIVMIKYADDDVVLDYIDLTIDQYAELRTQDPSLCYIYASGDRMDFDPHDHLPQPLLARERALQERAVRTARQREGHSQADSEALWDKIRRELAILGVSAADIEIIGKAKLDKSRHAEYCSTSITFMNAILRLPRPEAAMVMREMLHRRR